MNRTKIEWVKNPDGSQGYTWNPITGCNNQIGGMCQGGNFPCYAYKLAHGRLRERYLGGASQIFIDGLKSKPVKEAIVDPFYPRFRPERLYEMNPISRTRKGMFVCDMSDLFGVGIPEVWTTKVLAQIKLHPEHRFYLLTKQPQNLIKFSPFPENCFVGVTATNWLNFSDALGHLAIIEARVKYLSFEPLLGEIKLDMMQEMLFPRVINWLIIGAQTRPTVFPRIEWVEEIVRAADKAGIPVFLKNNLELIIPEQDPLFRKAPHILRQEMPK